MKSLALLKSNISNHSFEAVLYSVQVMMTTDTALMQLHKCFSPTFTSMLEAVAGFTLTGCYICRPWPIMAWSVSRLISPTEAVAPAQEPR